MLGSVMLRRWLFLFLVVSLLLAQPVYADDDDDEDDDDDDDEKIFGIEAEGLGDVSLYLLIGTILIVVWKPTFMWLRKNGPDLFNREPREFKKKLGVYNRRFMKVHLWIGFGAAILGTIHGYVLEWHWTLWLGTAFIWVLVISGTMMKWRWPPREMRKGARLLHMQRTLTILSVVLLLIGHGIVD